MKKKNGKGKAAALRSGAAGGEGSPAPGPASGPEGWNGRWTVPGVCVFLAAITWVVFGQTLGHEFVNYDDKVYVYENPEVARGLTWEGFRWALTYAEIGHWHPLTWLSHMLDCQLYGLHAGGHHLTSLLLHGATVILLFLVLRQLTGFLWRSAFVAAVFAVHPLHVESVAWVAERKDVLSALFFMLTLGAYVHYVRRPQSMIRYGTVVTLFALGLLSKNMLVTLPFVLLLLDYWPLNRLSGPFPQVLRRRVAEKIPLFVLAFASCVATALVPEKVTVGDQLSFPLRMENAVVSCVTYLWQMIHPVGLACVYPNPVTHLPPGQVAGALGLLLAISGVAYALRPTQPWLVVGWLWYLGMLVPVIGLVQISYYAHADRYTYLPQIGLYLLLTWAAAESGAGWRHRRLVLGGAAAVILAALMICARTQAAYWRDSESLWTHTLACTSDNAVARNNLGAALLRKGSVNEAIFQGREALQIAPGYVEAHNNLGNALLRRGNVDEAIAHYQRAVEIKPDFAEAHNNLGNALVQKGRADEAIAHYQQALEIKPGYLEALNNLALMLATASRASLRDGPRAVALAESANQIVGGDNPVILHTLAAAYAEAGRFDDARRSAQAALGLAQATGQSSLVARLNDELKLYAAGIPFHQAGQ